MPPWAVTVPPPTWPWKLVMLMPLVGEGKHAIAVLQADGEIAGDDAGVDDVDLVRRCWDHFARHWS